MHANTPGAYPGRRKPPKTRALHEVKSMQEHVEAHALCETCGAAGAIACPTCGGTGNGIERGEVCLTCSGNGKIPCPDCGGD